MEIERLERLVGLGDLAADVLVVGAGPAGITVARSLAARGLDVLIVESADRAPGAAGAELNRIECGELTWSETAAARRQAFHGAGARFWDHRDQLFGVRVRGLGGSSSVWAAKCACFDPIDFEPRPWVALSGWPMDRAALDPFLDEASELLNLASPDAFERLAPDARAAIEAGGRLAPFTWQYAMSVADPVRRIDFGDELTRANPSGLRVVLKATATEILTDRLGRRATGAVLADVTGRRVRAWARCVVLAASAIENPRLLLVSRTARCRGLGNDHDTVGRYLIDHPSAILGRLRPPHGQTVQRRFGYFGIRDGSTVRLHQRGVALTRQAQQDLGLTNAAAYFMPDLEGEPSSSIDGRFAAVAALRARLMSRPPAPTWVKRLAVNALFEHAPNFAVRRFGGRRSRSASCDINIEGIAEQPPRRENRVALGEAVDRFGMPLARVSWTVGAQPRRALLVLAEAVSDAFGRLGLPQPELAHWVRNGVPAAADCIDMAHTMGTTRMSDDPRQGVCDAQGQVHGVEGLFVAGGSVFPTGGHANPTLMIVALSLRLGTHIADHLNARPRAKLGHVRAAADPVSP